MKKRILSLVVALVVAASIFSGCTEEKKTSSGGEGFIITVGYPGADETWQGDEYFNYITDKVGVDVEFKSLPADSAQEKARIWISSGSMPDVLHSNFNMGEYIDYAQQGMVKALPADWEEKYPNLGFSMAMTGILNELKEAGDGEIYGIFRPMDHYSKWLDEFRTAYNEGKDVRDLMDKPEYKFIDGYGFTYRKDWAKQLGIETDYIMTYDAVMDMAKKFKEADLGNVGAKNTVGIAADYTEAPNLFITAFNSSYKYFHLDENGRYVCGLTEDSTAEGVKAYAKAYREGILAKDFYTQKPQDLNSVFCSQRSGIIFPRAGSYYFTKIRADFSKANPDINVDDALDMCWIVSPDGKVHGREDGNNSTGYYFNPELDDEKFAKILELADYISSVEGGPQVRLGVPDVDYKKDGDEYVILREKNEDGSLPGLGSKYPSYEFFRNFISPQFDISTGTDPTAIEMSKKFMDAKRSHELSLLDWDVKRSSYAADDYVKFNAAYEVNSMFAEIIVAEGDAEKLWEKKRKEIAKAAKSVEDNMNKALLGK